MEKPAEGFTSSSSFCVAPWSSLYLDPLGRRGLCCVADLAPSAVSSLGHREFLNSTYVKEARRQMMEGSLPAACGACRQASHPVAKDFLNAEFADILPGLESRTLRDGTLLPGPAGDMGIVYLDYRAHACNLRCKICDPESSSAWLKQIESQPKIWREFLDPGLAENIRAAVAASPYEREFRELARLGTIRKIYFAGGEPLLSPSHWETLEWLIESGRAPQVSLAYNTNLSLPEPTIRKFVEKLSHFAEVKVLCSIDGTAETTEYLRSGLSYERFCANLQILGSAGIPKKLDLTLTSLTFTELRGLSEMLLALSTPFNARTMAHATGKSRFLRCEFLPQSLRAELAGEWQSYLSALSAAQREFLEPLRQAIAIAAALPEFTATDRGHTLKQIAAHDLAFPGKTLAERFGALPQMEAWFRRWSEAAAN